MKPIMNMEELQTTVGLLDNDQGIVHLSLFETDLYDLLSPYIEAVDYNLYFNFANRIIIGKYAAMVSTSKLTLIKKAVYYALKGEEYNLRTLINTMNLDYNPLENYELHETITSTSSLGAYHTIGELERNSTSSFSAYKNVLNIEYSQEKEDIEKLRPEHQEHRTYTHGKEDETITIDNTNTTGAQANTKNLDKSYAELNKTICETTTTGKRDTDSTNEHNVSGFNSPTYVPSFKDISTSSTAAYTDSKDTLDTTDAHTDSESTTENLGEREDSQVGTTTTVRQQRIDDELINISKISDSDTHTRAPHSTTENQDMGSRTSDTTNKTSEQRNTDKQNEEGNRQRDLHGRYGFNTVQTMIESERRLANLNIVDRIVDIVNHTICEGVLYTW